MKHQIIFIIVSVILLSPIVFGATFVKDITYIASATKNVPYTTAIVFNPETFKEVENARIIIFVDHNKLTTLTLNVNNQSCSPNSIIMEEVTRQYRAEFDCSNKINQTGTYNISISFDSVGSAGYYKAIYGYLEITYSEIIYTYLINFNSSVSSQLYKIQNDIISINNTVNTRYNQIETLISGLNNSIIANIWQYSTRTLTYYPQPNNITPQDIWSYFNRNLTYYETTKINETSIAYEVWNYLDRTLTQNVANEIWNYANRNLTYYPAPNNITTQDVWSYADRNLTYYPEANNLTAQDVWIYVNRTLTYYNVTDVNTDDISESVWTYMNRTLTYYNVTEVDADEISQNVWNYVSRNLTYIPPYPEQLTAFEVWNYLNRTLTQNVASEIWNYANRNLTYYPEANNLTAEDVWEYIDRTLTYYNVTEINIDEISQSVWNYINRNLTYLLPYPEPNNLSASEIWNYSNRNLTYYPAINETKIAEAVWNWSGEISLNILNRIASAVWSSASRTLTSFGTFISDIWNYNSRNLTYYPAIPTINNTEIASSVWNHSDRNLTYYPTPNNLTAQDIWNYTDRNLTYYEMPQINTTSVAQDLWNYSNRNLTYYPQPNNLTPQNIWEYANRNLTYYPAVNVTINETSIAKSVWNYTNRTLTELEFAILKQINAMVSQINTTSQQQASRGLLQIETHTVSEFFRGEVGTTVVMVKMNDVPVSGATVIGTYYYPNNTVWNSDSAFSEIATTGLYYNNFNISSTTPEGVYKVKITATKTSTGSAYSDNFEDGNDDGWANTGAWWNVQYNATENNYEYYKSDYGGFIYVFSNAAGDQQDFSYSSRIKFTTTYDVGGIAFRYADSAHSYDFYYRDGSGNFRLRKNGATLQETPYSTFFIVPNAWYNFTVNIIGGTIQLYVNNISIMNYTDSSPLPAGKVGFMTYNSRLVVDDINVIPYGVITSAYISKDFKIDDTVLNRIDNLNVSINTTQISEEVWNYTGRYTHGEII